MSGTAGRAEFPDRDGTARADRVCVVHNVDSLASPLFINVPHSGEVFPETFLARSQLSLNQLRRASDLYVDRLLVDVIDAGLPLMRALYPRSYVDLNREPLELDPRLIEGVLPVEANTRSLRVAGGLGTLPRLVGDQIEIYAGKLSLAEAMARIEEAYIPYHLRLQRELARRHACHGAVVMLDVHSMPSTGVARAGRTLADVVLGDRYGASAAPGLVEALEAGFRAAGLSVERNQPYAGGYITEHYGRPRQGWHAIQIEINRALYMNEVRLEPNSGFLILTEALGTVLTNFSRHPLFDFVTSALQFSQKAAE